MVVWHGDTAFVEKWALYFAYHAVIMLVGRIYPSNSVFIVTRSGTLRRMHVQRSGAFVRCNEILFCHQYRSAHC